MNYKIVENAIAIVAGIPAQIIGYRFSKNQIDALNRIEWWKWSEEVIGKRRDDFKNIELFISKYDIKQNYEGLMKENNERQYNIR